MRKYRKTF